MATGSTVGQVKCLQEHLGISQHSAEKLAKQVPFINELELEKHKNACARTLDAPDACRAAFDPLLHVPCSTLRPSRAELNHGEMDFNWEACLASRHLGGQKRDNGVWEGGRRINKGQHYE